MKEKKSFFCQECGYASVRWLGKCPACNAWNSFVAESVSVKKISVDPVAPKRLVEIEQDASGPRTKTGFSEFDRVLGGGIVEGSAILIAGEPGIGKSTLVLSVASHLSASGKKVLYVSAEESLSQLKLRAERLGISDVAELYFLSENEINVIQSTLENFKPGILIIDSIQLICNSELDYSAGSAFQVRENTYFFIEWAKKHNVSVLLIGHITKEGVIAGPKLLEHLVDVVVYFEGEQISNLRILRNMKNRFASTDEIGVFTMEESGLKEVPEASKLFLSSKRKNFPGAAIFPSQEGKRTILVEIQSLVSKSYLGVPRRAFTGLDYQRINLILAVLEKKNRLNLASYDVYFNVSGGMKITEPGADLAMAAATISSFKDLPVPPETVFLGEIALTGEIRPVRDLNARLRESARLGFKKAFIPKLPPDFSFNGIELCEVRWLQELMQAAFGKE